MSGPLYGLMQNTPLLISSLIEYAAYYHGDTEIVSRTIEGPIHRYNYRQCNARSKQLAKALIRLGVQVGDRVATLAWNGYRHLEAYYGVSGMGAVLHTINPRLFPQDIQYIAHHAQDKYILVDLTFVDLILPIVSQLPHLKGIIVLTDQAHMPKTKGLLCYDTLLSKETPDYQWPQFDEKFASSLCYTSGTTGKPKGVLYSHRSTLLHTWATVIPDVLDISSYDVVLPVVPMFHANAWGLAYSCVMVGAKMVFPGKDLDGKNVWELLNAEKVTMSAGVPTVWLMLLQYMEENNVGLPHMNRTVIGGAAVPASMITTFQDKYNVEVLQGWGMTEMSPLGTLCRLKPKHANLSKKEKLEIQVKQGRGIFGVEMTTQKDGETLPRDGKSAGNLLVRGPWILEKYYLADKPAVEDGQWFDTGDVATLDDDGFMQITDRSKDVIKSGGEWISSIDLENAVMGHPKVAEAAAIGISHPRWTERPLLIIVPKKGVQVNRDDILQYLQDKVAKWWLPDDVAFVDEIPHTATGKILKTELRKRFGDHRFPQSSL